MIDFQGPSLIATLVFNIRNSKSDQIQHKGDVAKKWWDLMYCELLGRLYQP